MQSIWFNSVYLSPIMSTSVHSVHFGLIQSIFVHFGPCWSISVQISTLVHFGPILSTQIYFGLIQFMEHKTDKSYNHESLTYILLYYHYKLYPLINNSFKDLFFHIYQNTYFASCGRLIIGDISSKDEGFNIHVLPHMFHTTPFTYSPTTFITQLASSCFSMCKKHRFVYSK